MPRVGIEAEACATPTAVRTGAVQARTGRVPESEVQWEYMAKDAYVSDVLFEALTPLGFLVRVGRSQWELIIGVKHPAMAGRELDVKETLEKPEEIRLSRSDSAVYLFYSPQRKGRWVCAVTKRLDGEGFLITTYPTDAVKEGMRVWPK